MVEFDVVRRDPGDVRDVRAERRIDADPPASARDDEDAHPRPGQLDRLSRHPFHPPMMTHAGTRCGPRPVFRSAHTGCRTVEG
ncbi:hypothetical protein GCM10025870_06570 [Agromyces marinus]|uniref:Uncharacterized protein n=1 Tax=Agromyces marinus TaxID=1389020 RepID=A0ABN6Y8E9_9MICO|nr:hypothetical protein GCM10025870_06570 [Agromyces marinus]